MLRVIMLSVVRLQVVAPKIEQRNILSFDLEKVLFQVAKNVSPFVNVTNPSSPRPA